jgi:hypothetical protein
MPCGIRGDVVEFWFQIVQLAGRAPALWDRNYAAGDLMARLRSGEIDPSITTLSDSCCSAGPSALRSRIPETPFIAEMRGNLKLLKAMTALPCKLRPKLLPSPLRIPAHEVVRALFPANGLLLVTPEVGKQRRNIKMRDEWLRRTPAQLAAHSFISTSYLTRADLNSSYPAFAKRRWLVIEGDSGPLEQQFAIYLALARDGAPLRCVCYSGGKSLHAWFLVEAWPETKCFELCAAAIGLGIVSDCGTYAIRQPARLPGGFNLDTKKRQLIYLWNL